MKDKLTIVIPLKGRDYATDRILGQMVEDKCPFKVILADGSGNDNAHFETKYSSLNLEYYNFGSDETVHDFMDKMHKATFMVDAPYTMFADNDDLVCVEGVMKALEFLEENPDHVSFRGALTEKKDNHNFHTYPHSIDNPSVYHRVCEDLTAKDAAWQDITRTHAIQKLYTLLSDSMTQDLMLTFTMDSSFRLLYGYNKKDFSITTTYHISGDGMIMNRPDWLGFKGWMGYPDIYKSLGLYVSTIANGLNMFGGRLLNPSRSSFAEFLISDIYNVASKNDKLININKDDAITQAVAHSLEFDELVKSIL